MFRGERQQLAVACDAVIVVALICGVKSQLLGGPSVSVQANLDRTPPEVASRFMLSG